MHCRFCTVLLLAVLFVAAPSAADDWPQWRGPNRDGRSAEKGLLRQWPDDGPPLVWAATSAGEGYSTPSVADGKVFVMGNGENKEWIVCLDQKNGEQLWACKTGQIRYDGGGYPGPRSTPTYADGKIYAMGLAGRLVCCDADSGIPVWYRDMTRHFGGKPLRWGFCESVLVDEGRVICTPGGTNTVVALDAKNGNQIWAARAGDRASYSSVIKATFEEVPQYIAFTHRGLLGIRAKDGKILWRYDAPSNEQANCTTPIVLGKTVFAASGFGRGGGCAWIKKDDQGEFIAEELYFTNRMQSQHGGYLVVDKTLYGCGDPGVLVAMNYRNGVVTRAVRTGRFSIAYADGMLYCRNENGRMDLYTASSTNLTRRGSFEQPYRSEEKAWPHPVIADGYLYLRDQYLVLCYDVAKEREEDEPEEEPEEEPAEEGASEEEAGEEERTEGLAEEEPMPDEPAVEEPALDQPAEEQPTETPPAVEEPAVEKPAEEPPAEAPPSFKPRRPGGAD